MVLVYLRLVDDRLVFVWGGFDILLRRLSELLRFSFFSSAEGTLHVAIL